jgi:acetoacetate decarboxylase
MKEAELKIDRTKIHTMPLIRGQIWERVNIPGSVYSSQESIMLQYKTDPDAIPSLLPEPYLPGKNPIVTVMFCDNNGVDFMAGGGYRFAAISVDALIETESGHLEGAYVMVMPENKTLHIFSGREWLGMPKFYTDISPIRVLEDNHLRCETSLWGYFFFGLELSPPFLAVNI